jgi:hypothetical protein
MTKAQADALIQIRGTMGQRAFAQLLVDNGLPPRTLSRQRLSQVERGDVDLPTELWEAVIAALVTSGRSPDEVAALRPEVPAVEPAPPNTAEFRRLQWLALAERLPHSRWWQNLPRLVGKVAGQRWVHRYYSLLQQHGIEPMSQFEQVKHRLSAATPGERLPGDAVELSGDHTVRLRRSDVALFRLTLHNTGSVAWRERLLYRLGPPVTSSLPFTPAFLPVPDTDPGVSCEVFIPCRAQFFPNLAMVSYVMVFADCSPCLPGRMVLFVDTRSEEYDSTLDLPEGFTGQSQ